MLLAKLQNYWDFTNFSPNECPFPVSRPEPQFHTACAFHGSLLQSVVVPQSFLVFLDILQSGFHSCRMSLNLGLANVFSWLDWGDAFLARMPGKWYCPFSVYHVRQHMVLICLMFGNVELDSLTKWYQQANHCI